MSDTFGGQARSLAAIAGVRIGWAPQTFWDATPSELVMTLANPMSTDHAPPSRQIIQDMIEREQNG